MSLQEGVLRLYRLIGENESLVENELRKLGEIIKTRSQLNRDLEYLSVSKINQGDIEGVLVIRGRQEKVSSEIQLLTTLIKTSFKSIDVEDVSVETFKKKLAITLKNFF